MLRIMRFDRDINVPADRLIELIWFHIWVNCKVLIDRFCSTISGIKRVRTFAHPSYRRSQIYLGHNFVKPDVLSQGYPVHDY